MGEASVCVQRINRIGSKQRSFLAEHTGNPLSRRGYHLRNGMRSFEPCCFLSLKPANGVDQFQYANIVAVQNIAFSGAAILLTVKNTVCNISRINKVVAFSFRSPQRIKSHQYNSTVSAQRPLRNCRNPAVRQAY